MYNVKRSDGGVVTITEVGDDEPMYKLGADTFVTYRLQGSDDVEVKQVKDFGSDVELLQAIAHKVRI